LYLDGNQVTDLKTLTKLTSLDSLSLSGNGVSDLKPLAELTEWKYLILENNKIKDLGVLVEMAKKDAAGEQRFAPFWRIYLKGNPLSKEAQTKQVEEITKLGGRVETE
jgi:internalin A